jgi:coenzyme F420-reducing hydrogenase gamma subunit
MLENLVMQKKLRFGWFTLTCSEDNTIIFVELLNRHYFEWKDKIKFVYCKPLQSNNKITRMDVAYVEGAVSSLHEEKLLKKVRANSRYLVAVGACACTGMPSGQRNLFNDATKKSIRPSIKRYNLYEKVKAVKDIVKTDAMLFGCPMSADSFVMNINGYLKEFGVDK